MAPSADTQVCQAFMATASIGTATGLSTKAFKETTAIGTNGNVTSQGIRINAVGMSAKA